MINNTIKLLINITNLTLFHTDKLSDETFINLTKLKN